MFLLFVCLAVVSAIYGKDFVSNNSIPISYNVSVGRNESYTNWCKVSILPSHAGYVWKNLPITFWAVYYVFIPYTVDAVQITAAKSYENHDVPLVIVRANAQIKYNLYSEVEFLINWGSLNIPVYIGLLNPHGNGKLMETWDSLDTCEVTAINYGPCATNTGDNC